MRWRVGRWACESARRRLENGNVGSDIPVRLSLYMSVIRFHSSAAGERTRGFLRQLGSLGSLAIAFQLPFGCSPWRRELGRFRFFLFISLLPSGPGFVGGKRDGCPFEETGGRSCIGASFRWSGKVKRHRAEPIHVAGELRCVQGSQSYRVREAAFRHFPPGCAEQGLVRARRPLDPRDESSLASI